MKRPNHTTLEVARGVPECRLFPRVDEHEDIVGANAQHDEEGEEVEYTEPLDVEEETVETHGGSQ